MAKCDKHNNGSELYEHVAGTGEDHLVVYAQVMSLPSLYPHLFLLHIHQHGWVSLSCV